MDKDTSVGLGFCSATLIAILTIRLDGKTQAKEYKIEQDLKNQLHEEKLKAEKIQIEKKFKFLVIDTLEMTSVEQLSASYLAKLISVENKKLNKPQYSEEAIRQVLASVSTADKVKLCITDLERNNYMNILDEISQLQRIKSLRRFPLGKTTCDIDRLTGKKFEQLVAHYYIAEGYSVEIVGGANDFGVDLLVTSTNPEKKLIVQCKRQQPTSKVSSSIIQKLNGARLLQQYKGAKPVIFTTTNLTKSAITLCNKTGVEIITRDEAFELLEPLINTENEFEFLIQIKKNIDFNLSLKEFRKTYLNKHINLINRNLGAISKLEKIKRDEATDRRDKKAAQRARFQEFKAQYNLY